MWTDILTAICLVFIIEGVMPFLNPAGWKSMMRQLLEIDDKQLRIVGLVFMLAGVLLLSIIR
ncbi:MAG: DUF2065 domain-containing protein [Gammaproteobacteria bacterium]|nr:DUF2065 domain-containing protein [Gammaproteobacteria bacterium]